MKKLVLFLLVFACVTAFAQDLKFFYNGEEIHDTVLLQGAELGRMNNFTINILNNTDSNVSITIQKENLSEAAGSYNTFCMGQCFDPSILIAPEPLILAAHTQTTEDDFHVVYNPGRTEGSSLVKYNFIIGNETYSIIIIFTTDALSINNDFKINKFNAYPNPCTTQVQIQYDLAKYSNFRNANIVISNLVGKKLETVALEGITGKKNINVSTLPAGIYFYSIEVNGRIVSSKKLIIK